jgi:hypothetical protein
MLSLTPSKAFVGLDDHTAFVQVCAMDAAGKVLVIQRCENNARAIAAAVRSRVGESPQVFAAIEACCGAANRADELFGRCG